jgi:hypothetical protein
MLKTYPQCFIASELVEWLLKQKITETREQAVGLSSYLVDKQSFHAVNSGNYTFVIYSLGSYLYCELQNTNLKMRISISPSMTWKPAKRYLFIQYITVHIFLNAEFGFSVPTYRYNYF